MTLASRLSLFFLGTLAFVLIGFSVVLYALAHRFLFRQVEDQGTALLDTLAAAAEVDKEGIEWEPHERFLHLHKGATPGFFWCVRDDRGRRLDGDGQEDLFSDLANEGNEESPWKGERWWFGERTLRADGKTGQNSHRHRCLTLAVAIPLDDVHGKLRVIAIILTGLSLTLWSIAALVGRHMCRRALVPLTRMARASRAIGPDDREQRLPTPGTHDELEDLCFAFNDLLGRLQESFERQRRFTAEASHQLRTPLTAMLGQVEVALRRERTPEEGRRVFNSVQKQAVQLKNIVEQLLFLARADAEARLPQSECLELATWLAEHMEQWSQHPRHIDIRISPGTKELLSVSVHDALLGQAVDNLLDNACKYSEPGTIISLALGREAGDVVLTVEDQGCGINAEELPHLFAPFFRSSEARRRGIVGVGLGLAVTRRIIAAFGGRVEASSQPGQGSRFAIRLPVAPVAARRASAGDRRQ